MGGNNGSSPSQTGFASVSGAKLFYEVAGSGDPVVLVHRGLFDRRMWNDQFHAFAERYRVVRYDIRGSGDSVMERGEYSHHDDLLGVMNALDIDRAHLVGLSLGGSICIDFALQYPDKAKTLVLASSGLGGYIQLSAPVKQYQMALFLALTKMNAPDAVELSLKMWVDGPMRSRDEVDVDVRMRAREMLNDALSKPLETYLPTMLEPTALERLAELTMPTLVITGDRDVQDTRDIAAVLVEKMPNAELAPMHNVAHMLNMEQPDTFNKLVLDFLDAHSA